MDLLQQQRPHERVTTQNLLISAAGFERERGREGITLQTLKDLSTLIDLYCLYDRVVVLGRGLPGRSAIDSEFLSSLLSDVVSIEEVTPDIAPSVARAGARHLATCLNQDPSDQLTQDSTGNRRPPTVIGGADDKSRHARGCRDWTAGYTKPSFGNPHARAATVYVRSPHVSVSRICERHGQSVHARFSADDNCRTHRTPATIVTRRIIGERRADVERA